MPVTDTDLREHRGPKHRSRRPFWGAALIIGFMALVFGTIRSADSVSPEDDPATRAEAGRGRFATSPSEIPARGWKDILLRVYRKIWEDRIMVIAAGVTFYALLALFPAIAALVSLYGLFADPATINSQLDKIASFMPGGAIEVIRDQLNRVVAQGSGKLGITFIVGLCFSLWSANAATKTVFDALNIVYREEEKRGFIKLNAISLAFTLAGIVFLLLAIVATVVLPLALNYIGLGSVTAIIVDILRWPILLAAVSLVLAVLYRYGPSRAEAQWRWISWGSAFAAIMWLIVSMLFSWYAAEFGNYNKTYGSLGAVIGFMTWIWLSTMVVLIGAELDAEMEHQTVRDSTTGRPKPLGARGATMADTVGAAQD
ncbi:MAG: rane protein [Rhodospirillaceae bacterium]|jgi:membrane protein|nr:rane protein [Rhodospirillaceae bacterium]